MTGADVLCDVLLANGITVCFANPGTSEMHFVAALDRRPDLRCVLGLAEGVVTGAADGYARMTRRPAVTLLHTGPGLANGLANLHNARRARTPLVNIVGDHATYHVQYDPPLATDIESLARPVSDWVRRIERADDVAEATQAAIDAAIETHGIATLILPADASWSDVTEIERHAPIAVKRRLVDREVIAAAADRLRANGPRTGILVGQDVGFGPGLETLAKIAAATGATLLSEVFVARTDRGRGKPYARRIPYPIDAARAALAGLDNLVMVGSREPVAFFAYPGKPSRLLPEGCDLLALATDADDQLEAAAALAARLGISAPYGATPPAPAPMPASTTGVLTDDHISAGLASALPEGAIIVSEPLTSGRNFEEMAKGSAPHTFMVCPSGGAIGAGLPTATGAALGAPGHKVICLEADGSGMYSLQSLWTQAREKLDVLTIIYSNRKYAILELEMANLGLGTPQQNAQRMMQLDNPALDWVALAKGMGVPGGRAETVETFAALLDEALRQEGPYLIECCI